MDDEKLIEAMEAARHKKSMQGYAGKKVMSAVLAVARPVIRADALRDALAAARNAVPFIRLGEESQAIIAALVALGGSDE